MAAREALFAETTKVLKEGGVVGLFPEGGSYTGWKIFQVMPGAAWSGVEYTLTAGEDEEPVIIVPTAITYTDKSRYGSRVRFFRVFPLWFPVVTEGFDRCTYGKPIGKDADNRV